jgi:hypothetical protein
VDPSLAHASGRDEIGYRYPIFGSGARGSPQQRVSAALSSSPITGAVRVGFVSRGAWAGVGPLGQGAERYRVQLWPQRCMVAGRLGHSLVGDQLVRWPHTFTGSADKGR